MTQLYTKGYAMLLMVVLLGAAGVAVATAVLYLSVAATQTASTQQEGVQANWLANACAEQALQQLVTSSSFTGTASTTLGAGTCGYTVSTVSSSVKSIRALGAVGQTMRKVQILIGTPSLIISSWQEVADFN